MRGVSKPVRARGFQRQALDLSFLLHPEPLPRALREHFRNEPTSRVVSHVHDYRVHASTASHTPSRVPVRDRRVSRGGRAKRVAAIVGASVVAIARERVSRAHNLRHARARARTGISMGLRVAML